LEDVLKELISKQVVYWRGRYVYDKFSRNMDYVDEVLSIEIGKYVDTITRGVEVVDKIIRKSRSIGLEKLIEIYDSHGIPPEIVVERAKAHGLNIELPRDFYSRIVEKHGGSRQLVKEKESMLPNDVVEWARGFEPTKTLFHIDPYMRHAEARVLGVRGRFVVFDQTIFYPKAGGQDDDKGYVVHNGVRVNVVNVYKVGDVIVHELEKEVVLDGVVEQYIDWVRRYRLMRHHTATHVLLGVLRKLYGDHVWQAGVEKTVDKARLDITHYKVLSPEEIEVVEREVNSVVDQRIDLVFHYLDKFSAEKKYGIRIYQGGAIYSPMLRIVEIPGVDAEACFGTHLRNTGEIGGFKIIGCEKIQDGVVRLEYTVATNLPNYITGLVRERELVLKTLGGEGGDLLSVARNVRKDMDELHNLLVNYRNVLKKQLIMDAVNRSRNICGVDTLIIEKKIEDQQLYKTIVEELALKNKYLVILLDKDMIEISINPEKALEKEIDLRNIIEIMKKNNEKIKGGGRREHIFIKTENPQQHINTITHIIEETICKTNPNKN